MTACGPGSRTPTRQIADGEPVSSTPTVDLPTSKIPTIARGRAKSPTIKPSAQAIKALAAKPESGGAYSMTNKPSARTVATRPTEPRPISFEVAPEPSGSVRLTIDGRTVALSRREARTLADKLLRAVK